MYRFTRSIAVKEASRFPAAVQFTTELCGYLDKTYGLKLKFGIELFGSAQLHRHLDAESMDALHAINAKLLQDRQYIAMLDKVKDLFVEGSLKDTIISLLG